MSSKQSSIRMRPSKGWSVVSLLPLLLGALIVGGTAGAEGEGASDIWEALTQGDPTLNVRGRIEIAKRADLEQSEAYTIRTRLGYGTKPFHGVMIYSDFENVAGIATEQYNNALYPPTLPGDKTPIADPTMTQVNQAYMKIVREDWLGAKIIGGRQRIIFDDSRFIGNVGWRQNEQTYDAARGSTNLGLDDLELTYGYIGYVRRIFGDQGLQPDWKSNSHLINLAYRGIPALQPTAFVYLLDFDNKSGAPAGATNNSSATYGLRLTGKHDFNENWKVGYAGSYAYQTDFGTNANSYQAHYVKLDASLGQSKLGKIAAGWEMLGSDNGMARFLTPLATAHKFNGWADVFLNNGGGMGLRDVYVSVAPKLPCKLAANLVYHHFMSDNGGITYGNEFDASLKRPINKHLDLLFKSAYFVADDASGLQDIYRIWFDVTVKF